MAAKANNGSAITLKATGTTQEILGGNGVDVINAASIFTSSDPSKTYIIAAGNGADTVNGSSRNEIIWGDSSGNTSTADNGADTLNGGGGNDAIHGGNGADIISGDLGADTLWGDRGGDVFRYKFNSDSSATAGLFDPGTGDWIMDYRASEGDKLDFSALHGNGQITGPGAPDELQWSGTTPSAYGIWYTQSGGNSFVYADTNGDGVADIGIKVSGIVNFVPGNFIGVNQAPVAADDVNSVDEDGSISGSVAGNDSDPDGDTLTYSIAGPVDGLTFNADGSYTFDASHAAYQHLAAGVTEDVVVSYTVSDGHGGSDTATLTITVTGVNDLASISGDTEGDVFEDGAATASGTLAVDDPDDGEELFQAAETSDLEGTYGDFTFDETTGDWEFTLDNAAAQGLGAGETAEETLTVTSADGTDSETIIVTIHGENDESSIGGDDSGSVTEDDPVDEVSGILTISDIDGADEEEFIPQVLGGLYGSLTIAADGSWTYTLDNGDSDTDSLNDGDAETDEFTVTAVDGTTHVIVITVHGNTDAPAYTPPPVFTGTGDPNDFDHLGNAAGENLSSDSTNGPDTLYGGAGDDTINAAGGNDTIYAGSGNDNIDGNNNNDSLYGGSGNDVIKGSNNDDLIVGGYGADTLTGGNGNDTFRYLSNLDTGDTITDMAAGDKIDLSAFVPTTFVGALGSPGAVGPNQVGYITSLGVTTIYVDTDGVAGADLEIYLSNGFVPVVTDFIGVV